MFVLYILGYIHWQPPNFAVLTSRNPQKLLAQADYLASLDNWEAARPYFAKAEPSFAATNVIASLWPTSDLYTATLMEDFYSHLAAPWVYCG